MATAPDRYQGRMRADERAVPNHQNVLLDAGQSVGQGYALVQVAGYGQIPSAANANTGTFCGVTMESQDNSAGAAGSQDPIGCEDGVYDFVNSATNPCSQADVGHKVYFEDFQTIGNNAAAGPPAGKLKEFNALGAPPGAPCRVETVI